MLWGRGVISGGRCAALGGGPQGSGSHEVVGERVPERVSLDLEETAHGKTTEAVVLAVCMGPLDALANWRLNLMTGACFHGHATWSSMRGFSAPVR